MKLLNVIEIIQKYTNLFFLLIEKYRLNDLIAREKKKKIKFKIGCLDGC